MEEKINIKTMSVTEMGKILGVGECTAYKLANDPGFYPAFKIGKKTRINVEALRDWMNEQGRKKDE